MAIPQQIKTLKIIIAIISSLVILGSGYLLLQAPRDIKTDPLFLTLLGLFIVNLVSFVILKIKLHQSKKTQPGLGLKNISKNPKPHSKA